MLQAIHLLVLISSIFLVESDKYVMKDVARPKSLSAEDHDKQIRNFWTPERLASATEFRLVLPKNFTQNATAPRKTATTTGPQISFPGSLPTINGNSSKAASASTSIYVKTTGRVFFTLGIYRYTCSGSVVQSTSGDLISTAAHCLYNPSSRTWVSNWIFAPGYVNGRGPYGVWTARRILVANSWVRSADLNADIGFVAVSTLSNIHIQAYVGAQGIGFNYPRLAYTYSFGYPANINYGLTLQQCVGYVKRSRWIYNSFIGQGLNCTMGGGSSGGPWIQNMTSAGVGVVTSVNSFTINTILNEMNGPYFSSTTAGLYANATTM